MIEKLTSAQIAKLPVCKDGDTSDPAGGPVRTTVTYFKPSGTFYTTDDAVWSPDLNHYSRWEAFSKVVRLRDMIAVALETPVGFPQCSMPQVEAGDRRAKLQVEAFDSDRANELFKRMSSYFGDITTLSPEAHAERRRKMVQVIAQTLAMHRQGVWDPGVFDQAAARARREGEK